MLPYLVLWIWVLVIGAWQLNKKEGDSRKKRFLVFSFFGMFLLQACRSIYVGADGLVYRSWFLIIKNMRWDMLSQFQYGDVEDGWLWLNKSVSALGGSYQALLVVVSLIILVNVAIFIYYNSKDVLLSVTLFMGLGHFLTSMSSLRQYMAMGFVLNVYTAMSRKKRILALVLAVIAMLFHSSSLIISAFIIILMSIKIRDKNRSLFFGGLIAIGGIGTFIAVNNMGLIYSFVQRYFSKYLYYVGIEMQNSGRGWLDIIYLVIDILLILFIILKGRKDYALLHEGLFIMIAASIIVLQKYIDHLWRLGFYFNIFMILVVPHIYAQYIKENNGKYITKGIIIFCAISIYIYILLTSQDIYAYQTFWSM